MEDPEKVQIGMPAVGSLEETKTSTPAVIVDQTNPHLYPIPRHVSEDPNPTLINIPAVPKVEPSNNTIPSPIQSQRMPSSESNQTKTGFFDRLKNLLHK